MNSIKNTVKFNFLISNSYRKIIFIYWEFTITSIDINPFLFKDMYAIYIVFIRASTETSRTIVFCALEVENRRSCSGRSTTSTRGPMPR